METKYLKTGPENMFRVTVERTLRHDTPLRMHWEFAHTVEVGPCANDFLALFASLVVRHGNRSAATFAAMMGVEPLELITTLRTLSGAGIREWTDAHGCAVSEALLRETDWRVERIAREARFSSSVVFSRFFRRTHGCSPLEWRWRNKP